MYELKATRLYRQAWSGPSTVCVICFEERVSDARTLDLSPETLGGKTAGAVRGQKVETPMTLNSLTFLGSMNCLASELPLALATTSSQGRAKAVDRLAPEVVALVTGR
jgi:hypothetical protein